MKQETPKETLVCSNPECKKKLINWTFAFWMNGKPYCSLNCAAEMKYKMEKVNRWTQSQLPKQAG